jgi:type IV pilus assembly protein PilM
MPLFSNLFKPFLPGRAYLGVDIGTASLKMSELEEKEGRIFLANYGILETYGHLIRVNSAIQTSGLKVMEKETAELVKDLLRQMKPKARDAVASIPSFAAFTALIDVPAMSKEELSQAIAYQARALVPLPAADVSLDWMKVGAYEDEKGIKKEEILLISVPNEQIERYRHIFRLAGLNLLSVEVEGLSLARLLTLDDPTTSLIIDIGARSTAILIAEKGFLKYVGQTDFAGNSLTQALANGLGISVERAEMLKRQKGLLGTGGEYALSTLMATHLDVILSEVKRVRDIYQKNYRGRPEKAILSGGGANLLGIEKYVSDSLGLPAIKADPFSRIALAPEFYPLAPEIGASLSVSLGLSIKEFLPSI